MKAYLAAPIFTERDRNFNSYLESEILKRCPNLELYLAQNNASINDKTGCATSADIYVGDITHLKEADLLITIMSGDLPPIGSSYEAAYFCGLCEQDKRKRIVALYDDSREANHTYSTAKKDAMISGIAENQFPYINLLAVGFIKKWGNIYRTSKELIDAVEHEYNIGCENVVCGIYKITNLKNNMAYIGQSRDIYTRWRYYNRGEGNGAMYDDMAKIGLNYFKFEVVEKCEIENLDSREKFWIDYYDTYDSGYNGTSGGSGDKSCYKSDQCTPIYCYDLDGKFLTSYFSIAEAQRQNNLRTGSDISRCASFDDNHHMSANKMWKYYYTEQMQPYSPLINRNAKNIYSYDISTRMFVKAYTSATEAGRSICGKRNVHINAAANGQRKSSAGFLWAFDYFERLPDDYYENITNNKENMYE